MAYSPLFCSDEDLQEGFYVSRGVFTKCDCTTCLDTSSCSCRDLSGIYDLRGGQDFSAYSQVISSLVFVGSLLSEGHRAYILLKFHEV